MASGGEATDVARIAYFGPEGTFTHEALIDALQVAEARRDGGGKGPLPAAPAASPTPTTPVASPTPAALVPFPTIYETVMAVQTGDAALALVPIENSLEGSVNATLDTLAMEAEDVRIVGELVHPIHHCLVARTELELGAIEAVVSHPQATAQCSRF